MQTNKTRYHILRSAVNSMKDTDICASFDEPIIWKVNWASIGEQLPEKAKVFAENIIKAAEIAEHLNGFAITVEWEDDPIIKDMQDKGQMSYREIVQSVSKAISENRWDDVEDFLNGEFI